MNTFTVGLWVVVVLFFLALAGAFHVSDSDSRHRQDDLQDAWDTIRKNKP